MEQGGFSPEVREALEKEDRRKRNQRIGVVLLFVMLAFFGLDYACHPEARRFQNAMVKELKGLPLPPDTREEDFSSAFQAEKGIATRTIDTGKTAKELCAFYGALFDTSGWQTTQDKCYQSAEAGHVLIEFRR